MSRLAANGCFCILQVEDTASELSFELRERTPIVKLTAIQKRNKAVPSRRCCKEVVAIQWIESPGWPRLAGPSGLGRKAPPSIDKTQLIPIAFTIVVIQMFFSRVLTFCKTLILL